MEKNPATDIDLGLLYQYGITRNDVKEAVLFKFRANEFFLKEGYPIDYLYFVIEGKAKVCVNAPNGKQLLLCYFISDGIIGDLEFMMEHKDAFATLQALTDFSCIGLPLSINKKALKENIKFMNFIGKGLAYKLWQRDINSTIILLHPLEERLCAYIAQRAEEGVFKENLTDVAGLLGSSYRHLLRCLNNLCIKNILTKGEKGYLVTDMESLKKIASELYIL